MQIAYTQAQEELRTELRTYFSDLMTLDRRAALTGGDGELGEGDAYRDVVRQMGKDGWLALGWPAQYGGADRSMMDQLIFTDEAAIAGAPVPFLTINSVAPTIMHYGTDEQKSFFLPKIAAGDLHFSIGYSEPGAGTDLAALRTAAVREGDEYVINGQKMWTSLIPYADYVWLACRTDTGGASEATGKEAGASEATGKEAGASEATGKEAGASEATGKEAGASEATGKVDGARRSKHKGISMVIVPTTAEGFSYTPVHTMAGVDTSATYYQDVRVPVSNLVGEEGGGWGLVTNQLNHERVALCSAAPIQTALRETLAYATAEADGRRPADQAWVRANLARVHAKVEFLKLVNWKIASIAASGGSPSPADASATKVFGTEFATEAYRLLMEIVGPAATLRAGSPGAQLLGRLERFQRTSLILTFGGGTNEVQRDIIGMLALKLPPARR